VGRSLAGSTEAWGAAQRAASAAGVELRPLDRLEDADAILRIMGATWEGGEAFPREMLRALADSGNVPYGAFVGGEAIGYVLSWAGVEPEDGLHVHSHMLAALPDRRHAGVGFALKLAQRAQALEQGIGLVRWTFDPLVARNGYFNLHKLGATGDRFGRDFYGPMTDAINLGERSDRITVRWDLERDPGPRALPVPQTVVLGSRGESPGDVRPPTGRAALVQVPREYDELRSRAPEVATAWREAAALAIEACLGAGMVAAGFDLERSAYVLVAREDVPA
jgi:predicted GNAT superfamily acetyltransferase